MSDLVEQQPNFDLGQIFLKAIEKDASVDTIERLMAMQEKVKTDWARDQYYSALAKFQDQCPVINKTRIVKDKNGRERYRYAPLEDILPQVAPLLKECGFSYVIKTEYKDGFMIAYCETHHTAGHSEVSSFPVPIEKEAFMNEAQKAASAQSYGKRYAFCNGFGILTGDIEDDGKALGEGITLEGMYKKYSRLMETVLLNYESIRVIKDAIATEDLETAAEAWFELGQDIQQILWVAPKKGGPFTTDERKTIHSGEFNDAHFGEGRNG